jgi:hypothetical protein
MSSRSRFFALTLTMLLALPAAARTPTNNAAAFKTFGLYSDRTSSGNTSDHLNFAGYPSFLASPPPLLVMRPIPGSPDTMALFNSFAKDATQFMVNATQTESFSTYTVSPPQFATSLGSLLMGVSIYNGSGAFADFGKQLATATVTYVDGDTTIARLNVGTFVRDYFDSGPSTCSGVSQPLYTTRPTDPLTAYIYESGGNYFDAQESLLPKSKRSKRIASIRIESTLLSRICGPPFPFTIYSGSLFSGFSIWPNFTIVNASLQPVVRLSQFTGVAHGGYMFAGQPVGTRRLTNATACQVASMAMTYTYAGFNCTVNALNTYLQQNRGYEPEQVAIVKFVSPTGDAIRFTATGKSKLNVDNTFVVEHGTFSNPLATYRVSVPYQRQPYIPGQATRILTHSATIPSINDPGRIYWNMRHEVADGITSSPQLRSIDLHDSPQLAAQVESLLVRDIPVQLNVPDHFVVAHGWTSSFRPDGSARGTYFIRDPFDDRNYTKLIEGKYHNTFTMARYVVPTGLLQEAGSIVTGGDPPGLSILASGARRVEIIDPLGRHMMRDANTGEGVYDIPGGAIQDISSEHDNGGDVDDPLTGYDLDIPTTVDGHYTVTVYSDDGLSLSANGYNASGIFASEGAVDTTAGAIGNTYDVLYSGSGQSVSVTHTATIGVNSIPRPDGPSLFRVRHSPTTGPVEFVLNGTDVSDDAIEVFDITGRRLDVMQVAGDVGTQVIRWDWRSAGIHPGVYLARLRSRGIEMTRFVILH